MSDIIFPAGFILDETNLNKFQINKNKRGRKNEKTIVNRYSPDDWNAVYLCRQSRKQGISFK